MSLRPLQHVRWNTFIAIAIYLKLLTITANISISRCCRSPRSASDTVSYFTMIILKQYFSNFWILAVRHFGDICFLTDDWKEISHISKFVFWSFYILFITFLDSTKLKIVWIKITTFFKQHVSIILWSFSS